MKRVLLISFAAAFCVTACGDKSQLGLKAREMKANQQKPGEQKPTNPSEKPGTEGEGTKNMPTNANDRRILVNGSASRNILLGDASMTTTVFCSDNLAKAQKEKERIKLQGNSQIIVRQATNVAVPEESVNFKTREKETPKTLLSLSCMGASADLNKEPADADVTVTKLTPGKSATAVGKFTSLYDTVDTTVTVTCVTAKDMANANAALLPEDGKTKASDILMAAQSKMLVQTASKDKDLKKYILITCDELPAIDPLDVQE